VQTFLLVVTARVNGRMGEVIQYGDVRITVHLSFLAIVQRRCDAPLLFKLQLQLDCWLWKKRKKNDRSRSSCCDAKFIAGNILISCFILICFYSPLLLNSVGSICVRSGQMLQRTLYVQGGGSVPPLRT